MLFIEKDNPIHVQGKKQDTSLDYIEVTTRVWKIGGEAINSSFITDLR